MYKVEIHKRDAGKTNYCTLLQVTLFALSFGNRLFAYHLAYKYDLAILLHSKSLKKCRKKLENPSTNKNLTPKIDLHVQGR